MSRGTLIAEAGEDSGTLITARLALEANHDVFVIPADMNRE
jgi:predicted Rossmann fold nucleotide-binding protein DprA/Smf involved in DNA uptake